jgi:hypothetical protein
MFRLSFHEIFSRDKTQGNQQDIWWEAERQEDDWIKEIALII